VEERFVSWVEDGGDAESSVFSLRSGCRKRRALSSPKSAGRVDFETAYCEAQVISSESETENVIIRSQKKKGKAAGPAKIRRKKGSPKLSLGPGPNLEDYTKLNIYTNEEIRDCTTKWLDEAEAIRKKSANSMNGALSGYLKTRIQFAKCG